MCASGILPCSTSERLCTAMQPVDLHEADLQAPQPQAQQQAWLPPTHADQGRTEDPRAAPCQGPQASHREDRLQVEEPAKPPAERRESGGDEPRRGPRLPRPARVRRGADIRALFRQGRVLATDHLEVFIAASAASRPRLGLVVPKYGRSAVARNRLKRRLRELGRTLVIPALWDRELDVDVLIRARRKAYGASWKELQAEVAEVVEVACSGRP